MGNDKDKGLVKKTEQLFTAKNLIDKAEEQKHKVEETTPINIVPSAAGKTLGNMQSYGVFGQSDVIKTNDFGTHSIDEELNIDQYTTQDEIDQMRDDAQGFWGATGNAVGSMAGKVIPKLAEQVAGIGIDLDNYDSESNKTFIDAVEKARAYSQAADEMFPIYGVDDESKGTWSNPEWLAKNIFSEGGASALGMMAIGYGLGGVAALAESTLFKTAMASGNAVINMGKVAQGGEMLAGIQKAKSIVKGISTLGQAYAMNTLEGGIIGYDVAKDVYGKKQQEYIDNWKHQYAKENNMNVTDISDSQIPESVRVESKKYANDIASSAGKTAYDINKFAFVFNLTGVKYFTAAEKSTEMAVKRTFLNTMSDLGLESLQEGGEELVGGSAERIAKRQANQNLTAKNGGGAFGRHDSLGYDIFNHIFSKQGLEEFVSGAAMGGMFGATGNFKDVVSGKVKADNKLYADQQAMIQKVEGGKDLLKGVLDQAGQLDPKSKVVSMIQSSAELAKAQTELMPLISEAYLAGDTGRADALRAKLLQFQAYDYFDKGLANHLLDTVDALANNKEQAIAAFGENYQSKINETKKVIQESKEVYDTYVPMAPIGSEKILYQNILNRNNLSKALTKAKQDQGKARVAYMQELNNYNPAFQGLDYQLEGSAVENEFKAQNPLVLQELEKANNQVESLSTSYKENLKQFSDIQAGKYFVKQEEVKQAQAKEVEKQEAKLTKEQEIANNTKVQQAQSLANDIQDESKPEVTKDAVNQGLDEKIAEIDSQVANEEITPEEAEVEKAKIEEIKAEVETKTTPVVEEVSIDETPSKFEDIDSIELTNGFSFDNVSGTTQTGNVDSEGNMHSPVVKTVYTGGFNEDGSFENSEISNSYKEGQTLYKVYYHENGTITYQVSEEQNTLGRAKVNIRALINNFTDYRGKLSDMSKINTLEPGILKEENGKLVIVKKAKIEYSDALKPFDGTIIGKVETPKVAPVATELISTEETVDNENGVLGDNEPMMEIPEDTVTEEVVVKPSKKLVYVPTSISVKTVSSKDNALTGEASNEGGEGGADIDKVQASNVLDNSENSVQKGTNLFITPTEVLGQKAYQFTTEDGRLVGYLHKPEYVRTSRVAVEKLTDEEREAELARQTEELKGMWASLDTHFSATSEPYRTVVTDKTPGTINRTPSDNKVKPEILADERVVVVPVIADSSQPGKNKLNLAGLEINEYLEKLGGILDEQSYAYLVDSEGANGNHYILVPTAARLGGKIVYNFAFANRTVLSDNPEVKALVQKVVSNYLTGNSSSKDQGFVEDILTKDIEFGTFKDGRPKVKIKKDNALVTLDNMGVLDNIGIRLPLSYDHNESVNIAGQEFVPQQFIGGTLKSNLNYSTIKGDVKSYVMNPVISFEPVVLSSSVVPAMEEVVPVKKPKPPVKKDIYNSPKDVEENPLLSLDKLSTEKGFNIIKKQEIVKAISVLLFRFITKKGTDNSVSDVLKGLKEDLVDSRDLHEYFVENGLEQEDIDNGFLDNMEHNQSVVDNLNYTIENWEVLSDNALNLLKETGYNLKKDTKDLSTAEIKPNPEEISDASIQNDTADTVDSTLVDKPEEASSSKYDKMMFEESMYEVSSAFVRTWLNSIGSGKKSVIGGVDSYGGKKLFGELLNIFKDRVYNEEDFKTIIAKEGVSKPQFADLAKKFDTLEPHYKVQILNSLDVTKANFRAVNPKGVFDSNRNTKEIQLKEMVNQGLQSLFNEGVGGQPNTLSTYGQAYMTKLNSLLENTDKNAALADVEVISILGDLGVPVSKEVLARLRADKKAFGKTLLEAIYGSIEAGQKAQTLEEVKMQDKLYYALVGAPASTTKMNLQEYIIESDGDSIVTVEGKKVYPFGIHHATSKLWANLKDRVKGSDLIKNLLSVPFISENTWLKSKTFGQIIYMDGAAVKEGSKAKTYANMTTEEKLMAKFEFFTRSTASNGTYSYWSSAKSDKSVVLGIEAPKIESGFKLSVAKIIAAEAKRINQFAKLPKEAGVNGSVFYLFPELNNMEDLFTETENGREVKAEYLIGEHAKFQELAATILVGEVNKFKEVFEKGGGQFTDDVKKQAVAFVTSELVNNYNFLSLVSGDPAYFAKLNKDGSVNIPKTMANLFKRLTRDIATAKRGRGVYKDLKVITFKEPEGDNLISKNFAQMEAILGEQASGYKNVQAADAQGYCTIKEYWDLMYGDGLISLEKRDALCKIFDDHFKVKGTVEGLVYSEADLEGILIKPRKPVTIGNKFSKIGDSAVNRPIYIKYSIFPLLPQLLHADSPLIKLSDFMENNGVHRAVAESGFKVGSGKPVDIEAETITATEDQFTVVDREMDGNQLDIPYDETKEAILQGTQLLKLVFDGVADSELKEVFYKNQEALLDKMNSDYIDKMGISEVGGKYQITDMDKFKKELAAALSDSFENPNDKVSFETVGNKFKLPLFFNKLGPKIESTLIQGFKKKVLKSKLAGRSFVLVSEYLFKGNTTAIATTPSYDPEKGLLPARLMKGDRLASPKEIEDHYKDPEANPLTVAPAQVMIAWNFKDENGNLLKMSDYVKDGKLDMDKIDPKMLKMIGYRIPTQGHNSMSVCEVVGFLPPYMGDTIVAPKDWTVQMGSDFDIDKVFMHFRYSKVDKAGKIVAQLDGDNGLKNTIYNNYEAVLSKTEVFKKMMIPLDFGRLPDIVKELQKIDRFKESQGSILSPVTQVNNYETGTAGKVGVGMSSLLSVFASIIQGKGLTVREGLSIKVGDRIIDLRDLSSPNQLLDPTKSKNMVISAFQSASVDNIKELLVKTINYNSDTHPLLISMSLLGLDEEWISYMMVQDIKPLKIAFENYKGFEPKPLTLELMKQAVSNPTSLTTYEMANLYHHYDSFKLLGDEISKLSGLVNITTNGFGTYFEDINYLQESSNILLNARSLEEQGMTKLIQDGFWGKGWKFMQNTQDVIGQLFPVRSSLYKTIMAYGNSEEFIKYPTKEYKKALKNFVKAYMMSDLSMFGGSVTEQRQRLFYGDNSLAHRASVLKAENPKNSFLQSLSFSFSNDGIKPNLVKYIGKGLTVTEKFLWQQQLKEMFYSENPIEAEFAKDFIIYQYAAGGIQVPTSAISMLPSDLTRLMKLDEDLSKIDWSVASKDVVNDILTQFKQSNKDKFKFEEQPSRSQGFFGMMTVVKNVAPNIKEEVVVNEVKTLDEALAEQAEGKFKGIIEDLGQLEPTTVEYVDSAEINNNAGEYDRGTGIIKIATDISKDAQVKTLIHETIHHVLSNTVKEYNKYKASQAHKLTPEGIVAMRRMERLYTVAQENFAKKSGPKRLENTLKNLDEFMSDMVSEKDVQKWSNDIEVSGESLWSKFKKLATNILQSLGLVKVKEGSLLEAFLDTYLEVKENRVVGKGDGKLSSPKKTSKYNKFTVLQRVKAQRTDAAAINLYNSMREQTKLNPLDVKYLNDTDLDYYYYTTIRDKVGKVVNRVSIDKLGDYLVAKEKSDREKSYTQKDISEIIKDVANSDRPLAGLAKHLVKYADLVKPKIEFTTDLRLPNHATESGFGDKAEGLYNNRTNVISINLGVNHPKGLEYTILHEYMHALTAHEIRRGGPKVDALKDLYEVAKDKLKNKELHTNTKYALLDWDEFIVGIFTNGMFIKELQSLPATGVKYKNLWENVLDSLLNILGITKKDSFYEEAFALATNIVEDHISYEEMMKRQEEFSNFVEDQFEESQFSAGDTMQSIEDFFNNCK